MARRPLNPGVTPAIKAEDTPISAETAAASAKTTKAATSGPLRLRTSDLAGRKSTAFAIEPDSQARAALATELGLLSLPRLRFEGKLEPKGRRDWELTAKLGATVVQPCVVTLEPVKTRIDERVARLYSADFIEPEGDEVEMPDDDRLEPLPEVIDLSAVMAEELSLALPLYPRSDKAPEVEPLNIVPPGAAPITDEDVKPFAGLKSLRDQLAGATGSDSAQDPGDGKAADKPSGKAGSGKLH